MKPSAQTALNRRALAWALIGLTLPNLAPIHATRAQETGTGEIFFPLYVYRTGAYAPSGIPIANGFVDYLKLVNERDGGVGGVKIVWEQCETRYDVQIALECYERFKARRPLLATPYSTGAIRRLLGRAGADGIPVHSMGHGLAVTADGTWFPWIFPFPATYWNEASGWVHHASEREGGPAKLKGKTIAHVYADNEYGKEPNPILKSLAKKYGFRLELIAISHPGDEQQPVWRRIRALKPDWIFLSTFGVMTATALKEAVKIGFPTDRLIGGWFAGSEADVRPAGQAAKGYIAAAFHDAGNRYPLFNDLKRYVYDRGLGSGAWEGAGETLYNRGLFNAVLDVEAIRLAQRQFGVAVPNGEQMRWALENFTLTAGRLKDLGLADFAAAVTTSCADHEGSGLVFFLQWDGKGWQRISDWIEPARDVIRPALARAAEQEGKALRLKRRDCAKEP
jgi:branched-chain amino acid transport system substrate-binding protein